MTHKCSNTLRMTGLVVDWRAARNREREVMQELSTKRSNIIR